MKTISTAPVFRLDFNLLKAWPRLERLTGYMGLVWSKCGRRPSAMLRIFGEMAFLKVTRGLSPSYYLLGGFYEPDVSWAHKAGYMGPSEFEELVWRLNDPDYRKISQNKLAEKALLGALALPTARFFGFLEPGVGRDFRGHPLRSVEDLTDLFETILVERGHARLCLKKPEGWNGAGFQALTITRNGSEVEVSLHQQGGTKSLSVAELYASLDFSEGFIVEALIDQHPEYAKYHPSSVNSYRVWVVLRPDGTADVPLAYLRFGCGGALVDNGEKDRLVVPVDLRNGRMLTAHVPSFERETYERHPDTGIQLTGKTLPFFKESIELAIESVRAFPGMRIAGVDIAVSCSGPLVIELNPKPNELAAQRCRVPLTEVFQHAFDTEAKGQ